MKNKFFLPTLLLITACSFSCNIALVKVKDPRLNQIKLPAGFSIGIYAKVDNARSLALGTNGTVFVGNRNGDKVYALVDADKNGEAEKQYVLLSGLNMPNGVAFHNGSLYVAEVSKVWRLDNIEANLATPPAPVLITDAYPDDEHHGWKYIAFGPDGKLYIPVGAPCNICNDNEKDPRYSSITRINPDGSGQEVYAHGIRNTVGFAWHPVTGDLWFTENGRDMLGDDIPPDELNRASEKDQHFGYPYCHAGTISDPEYGKDHDCNAYVPPVQNLAPHTAALGMKFYTGNMFPQEYKNQIIIAEHGSWNRTDPMGYRVMLVKLDGNKAVSYEVFAEGWLQDGKAWGRPVDVLQLEDGSLLVSDDHAGLVYRITYEKK